LHYLVIAFWALVAHGNDLPAYRNANLPTEQRVEDLLQRMTLDEKIAQLRCLLGWGNYTTQQGQVTPSQQFKHSLADGTVTGMYWATFRADPWTQKTLTNGLNPQSAAELANAMQRAAIADSRLGIPMFLAEEAPHGHMAIGATTFPTGLGMAATWSRQMMELMGVIVAKEIRAQGAHISYGPVLDLCRDPRWSRCEETLGEDPCLSAELGAAMVNGLGGGDLKQTYATIPTLKHFIGYGASEGGQNGARSVIAPRELHQVFLPPFKRVIDAGALSIMTSYNSLDGVPCSANSYLLSDLLHGQWTFNGFVISDLYSIDAMVASHHTASDLVEAAAQALCAGVDVDLGGNAYLQLPQAIEQGLISESMIDNAVRRVLKLKFEMGLFDTPFVDPNIATQVVHDTSAINATLQMARQSITLLENDGILPLSKHTKVAIVGPNSDNVYNMLGDYTAPQAEGKVITVRKALENKLGVKNVFYALGCSIRDTTQSNIQAAVNAAMCADVIVAVVGGSSARDFRTSYEDTGAASVVEQKISDMECGEGFDRASLDLLGDQNKLLEALKHTGKPLIVVYIEGRPLDKNWASCNANALLTAYYPGEQGGNAIADVLLGDYNPAGRLPITVPRDVGQLPIYYNHYYPSLHNYVELSADPLYDFGYGLSYSQFEYNHLEIDSISDSTFNITFSVTNTSSRDGDEVVQLYVRDQQASVVQPILQLRAFDRIHIRAGQSRQVTLQLHQDDLALVNAQMQWVVEPGVFDVLIGASSKDIRLKGSICVQ